MVIKNGWPDRSAIHVALWVPLAESWSNMEMTPSDPPIPNAALRFCPA